MKYSEKKKNSLKKDQGVRLFKLWRGSRVPLLNFDRHPGPRSQGPEVPRPRVLVSLSHYAGQILPILRFK